MIKADKGIKGVDFEDLLKGYAASLDPKGENPVIQSRLRANLAELKAPK